MGVDLRQHTAGVAVIGLAGVEMAIVEHIQNGIHLFLLKVMAQHAVHEGQGVAHGIVAGADVDIIAIANGRPGIILPPVALTLVKGRHRTVAHIVNDTVHSLQTIVLVGDLLKLTAPALIGDSHGSGNQ